MTLLEKLELYEKEKKKLENLKEAIFENIDTDDMIDYVMDEESFWEVFKYKRNLKRALDHANYDDIKEWLVEASKLRNDCAKENILC